MMLRKSLLILSAALFAGSLSAKTVADLDQAQQQQLANAFQLYQQRQFEQAAPLLQAFDDIPQVQYLLGRMSLYGQGVTQDYAAGRQKISQTAAQHYAKAQYALARLLNLVEGEPAKALELYRQAAEQDYADAQFELAVLYQKPPEENLEKALFWYQKAAGNGHLEAQFNLADLYYMDFSVKNWAMAAKWYQAACDKQQHISCGALRGIRYEIQQNISRNQPFIDDLLREAEALPATDQQTLKTTVEHYRQQQFELAEPILAQYPQLAAAEFLLGKSYDEGMVATYNPAKALGLFRQAAAKGYPEAQYQIAKAYHFGFADVPMDFTQALDWYHKAANNSHAEAQNTLGIFYHFGIESIAIDLQKATEWYQKACDNHDDSACFSLEELKAGK